MIANYRPEWFQGMDMLLTFQNNPLINLYFCIQLPMLRKSHLLIAYITSFFLVMFSCGKIYAQQNVIQNKNLHTTVRVNFPNNRDTFFTSGGVKIFRSLPV